MSDARDPLRRLADLFFFAPIGLGLAAKDQLPELARKGHEQVEAQIALARTIGRMAVKKGGPKAVRIVRRVPEAAFSQLGNLFSNRPTPPPKRAPFGSTSAGAPGPPNADQSTNGWITVKREPEPGEVIRETIGAARTVGDPVQALSEDGDEGTVLASDLAIPGYDALAASQVVQRLAGLVEGELEAVRCYEQGTRARRTILSRIAQLQSG